MLSRMFTTEKCVYSNRFALEFVFHWQLSDNFSFPSATSYIKEGK